jgi:hypothetical protein
LVHVEVKTGKREGARAWRGTTHVVGIGPRPVGAGGANVARQRRAAGCERRGRKRLTGGTGDSEARWAADGCGRE